MLAKFRKISFRKLYRQMSFASVLKRVWWFAVRKIRGSRYRHLIEEINRCHPRNIMEIGTWNGGTAIKMIEAAAKFTPVENITYHGFDLFEQMSEDLYTEELSKRPPSMGTVQQLLETTGAKIHLYKGNTNEVLPEVLPKLQAMDFVFIDGGHSIQTIANDWDEISKYMHAATVVIFDDYWADRTDAGCKLVVDNISVKDFRVNVLSTKDNFINPDFGRLTIQFAKVVRQ